MIGELYWCEMAEEDVLCVGKTFNSIADAKACVEKYNSDNYTNFVVTTNNRKSLVYGCRHAVERKSYSGGKRPNQHYNYVGCTAAIRMYKSKDGKVKVMKAELSHTNHPVNVTSYGFNNE